MKKIIFVVVIVSLVGIGFVLSRQFHVANTSSAKSEPDDPKILVVQEFWNDALTEKDTEKYIIATPKEFYDETPRCLSNNQSERKQGIAMSPNTGKEDGFTRNLRQTVASIGKGQFTVLSIKNYRYWEKEAIVEVEFARTNDHNFREKTFFFLVLVEGKWKIFTNTDVPNLMNREYAKYQCPQ